MSVKQAFNQMVSLQGRTGTISRPGGPSGTVKYAPSNYFRNLEGPSSSVMTGREFVITKDSLDLISFPLPKRGDRLIDADMGTITISDVREMFDIGGAIIGYRIRTS